MNGTELNYFEESSKNEIWDECSGDGCNTPTLGGKLCGDCAVEQYQERIIKLLNNDKSLHNTAFEPQTVGKDERFEYVEMCVPFCPGCEAIALIKGEK